MVEDPHFLVRRAAEAAATGVLAKGGVDRALTSGRTSFLDEVRRATQEMLRESDAGVTVVSATLKRIEPPGEVIEAFQDVQNAKSDRERAINEANGYRNEILPRARGEAEAALSAAEADRHARVERSRGDADRFLRVLAEYRKAPQETRERLYLEVAERVLSKAKVYVIDSDGGRNPVGVKLID
ncbi:MAG: protease modulator HflK [Candidatus Eisenbacteria bacterium]